MIGPNLQPDKADIQGFILRGYTHPFSCHLLFSFNSVTDVKLNRAAFFKDIYPKVQSAEDWIDEKPLSMLNVGLTYNGIALLNAVSQNDIGNFPPEFIAGPWSQDSQLSLGDANESAPGKWWNGNFTNDELHCVIHTYGLKQEDLDTLVTYVTTSAKTNGLTELFAIKEGDGRLYQSCVYNDVDKIHFGYTDGISEPALGTQGSTQIDSGDLSNFLIGYDTANSYSQPGPVDSSTAAVFAKNGTYNAFRILYQDAAAFEDFLTTQANTWTEVPILKPLSIDDRKEWFAAKLMGRWRNGSPLILSPDKPDPATKNGELFNYKEAGDTSKTKDVASSFKCPFSAHTRVANTRDQTLSPPEVQGHHPRIIRRGMPYGPQLLTPKDDGVDRGLIGLFFCGSLSRQFEKVYRWMNYNNFSPPPDFSVKNPTEDAVLGSRPPSKSRAFPKVTTTFEIPVINSNPDEPVQADKITINGMPKFIQTRGTAYCLLPSLSSLLALTK